MDEEFARWACEHNRKWNDSNLFVDSSVTSLSSCCRLVNNVKELGYFDSQNELEDAVLKEMYTENAEYHNYTFEYFKEIVSKDDTLSKTLKERIRAKQRDKDSGLGWFSSIGGTALKVGSCKVSTINLARLAYENDTEEDYLNALENLCNLNYKALDVQRSIIKRNVDKGLLKNFQVGLVDFEHLYSTLGFIGIYETMKSFGYVKVDELGNTYYTKEADEFGKKIFDVIHRTKDEFMKHVDYHINCEQIPGETAAAKLMKKDEFFFPDKVVKDLPLYGNQFIPLGIKTTLQERIRIASLFDSYCNGGSILHVNVEAPFNSFDQAWDMLNYIADQGVTYFAFTTKIQACKNNHGFFGKVCPICGEPVETEYARIVG